jgi:ribosomal protein S18 acetylase RimI-like enzyme
VELRTLEHTSVADITAAFNEAFSDYIVRLQLTEESLTSKMKSENIILSYSAGAFEEDKLVGFLLQGFDVIKGEKTIYNAGTGVIPSFRGRSITSALYEFSLPLLQKEGIQTHLLEVIDTNVPAIKVYEKVGFKAQRKLSAFKSTTRIATDTDLSITAIESINSAATAFMSMTPAWQNSLASIQRNKEGHELLGVFQDDQLVGYAAYVPATGRVKQCAVHPQFRRKGIGKALFSYMMQNSSAGELVLINIDEAYQPGMDFLKALGFQKFLSQFEMKLVVPEEVVSY